MNRQCELWHDNIFDALTEDIGAIGGIKKVAGLLWKPMPSSSAEAKLRACLNPDQSHKLDLTEVMMIKQLARDAGSTATVDYEAQQLGMRVEWFSPDDDKMRLQREFIEMGKRMERMAAQINGADSRIRSIK